ncbi:uncharacterized protein BYT42DRAFT_272413 [Radiomyces spectabilis]|uniref:uncharacterized protein n=1 Tax=Radiomyces spectabilis TaxID=64574 RepID=UPI00221F5D2F|nr:uncharacterized protein BYT42DRAFT_272413 [Radiomyces spectabilis]KAI8384731.1 hypothetical protein BYT42DRAFT_272413 [Radiomyces spectabilis]
MSAFPFIHRTPSSTASSSKSFGNLSVSLADELYDSQIAAFVNPSLSSRPLESTHFSRTISNQSSTSSPPLRSASLHAIDSPVSPARGSAFSFMRSKVDKVDSQDIYASFAQENQAPQLDRSVSLASDVELFVPTSRPLHQRGDNKDIKRLSAESTQKRITAEKKQQYMLLQRLYDRYKLILTQISQVRSNNNLVFRI